jgi:hypothetical protein
VKYTLKVSRNQNLSSPLINVTLSTTSYTVPAAKAFSFAGLYYWRVTTTSPAWQVSSPVIGSFLLAAPAAFVTPRLLSPVNGAVIGTDVTLSWYGSATVGGLTPSYEFQVAYDSSFNNYLGTGSTDAGETQAVVNLVPGKFYWRVRAVYADLAYSRWSMVRMIIVQ